jgi:hypothetical protein
VTLFKVVLASSLDIFGMGDGFCLELELDTDARCCALSSRRLRVNVTHILFKSVSKTLLMVYGVRHMKSKYFLENQQQRENRDSEAM